MSNNCQCAKCLDLREPPSELFGSLVPAYGTTVTISGGGRSIAAALAKAVAK